MLGKLRNGNAARDGVDGLVLQKDNAGLGRDTVEAKYLRESAFPMGKI